MSTVADFNRIDDCDKIDSRCIDAFSEVTLDEDGMLCVETSWGSNCVELEPVVKAFESCTSLYLSPEENPNCLVYEKEERCGDNDCIDGDDLSHIISMALLKDVDQTQSIGDGECYIYNNTTNLFEPYDIVQQITNINTAIQNIQATLANHENRLQRIEALLVPPEGAGQDAKLCWGTINIYGDYGAVINDQGVATSLDKSHGLYTHSLNSHVPNDQVMG